MCIIIKKNLENVKEKQSSYMCVMLQTVPLLREQLHVTLLSMSFVMTLSTFPLILQKSSLIFQFRFFNFEFIASRAFTVRYKVN